ncbi:MAG: TolC family protein [Myxococcota bacterium]|nr:TolC family protein [Myxococcota bacterium]
MRSSRLVPVLLAALSGCVPKVPQRLPGRVGGDAFATVTFAQAEGETRAEPAAGTLTLAAAFERALARNEQLSLAERDIISAEIRYRAAYDAIRPNVSLEATGVLQREQKVGTNVLRPGQRVVGGAVIQQPLFRKGVFAARAAGQRAQQSADATRLRAREELARDVAEVFITVLRSRKLLELAGTAVGRAKTQYDLAVGRFKVGQSLKNAELLALIDLRRAELQAVTAQRDADAASVAFARLVGQLPPATLEMPASPALPAPAQAIALARKRADLRALEHTVAAATSEEEFAEGQRWWPQLDLEAGVQVFSPEVLQSNYDWSVVGRLTVPLVQRGTEVTEIALRRNAVHVAALELEVQRKIVVEEIEQAAIRVDSAAKAAVIAEKQLETAREHYKLVDKQVRLGAITFLEVTNAQAVLVEAENAFEIASMDRMLAAYDYLYAIGDGDLAKR